MEYFDLRSFLLLLAALLNFTLGVFVLSKSYDDMVSRTFGVMTLLVSLWSFSGFLFSAVTSIELIRYIAFVLYAVAALLPTSFLMFALSFQPVSYLSRRLHFLLIFETLGILTVTFWPGLVISGLNIVNDTMTIVWGPWYWLYVVHQGLLFLVGYYVFLTKYFVTGGLQKMQIKYIILGTFIPANLAMLTNLIMPWFGDYRFYSWMGQIFMLFLVLCSAYSIFKHRLFNLKVIATETFVVSAALILLVRFFISTDPLDRWLGGLLFVAVSVFGALLIRSVWKEVEQRQKLQSLTKQLASANKKLKDLDRARAEFISIASHQLRTPPATIKWYLAAIIAGDYGRIQTKAKTALQKAQMTNNMLISLIDDLLNVSRIERGKMEFIFEATDIQALTEETVNELIPQAKMRKLKLVYIKPHSKLPEILADKEKIQQVINNLIDNAIKYTRAGQVEVFLDQAGPNVVLKVKDTGKGMTAKESSSIFKKFTRTKDSKNHAAGLGLGLYVAKVIVTQHKGTIKGTSSGPGQGSVFEVTLPIKSNLKAEVLDLTKT
jgi:signal transduction histidine kinase